MDETAEEAQPARRAGTKSLVARAALAVILPAATTALALWLLTIWLHSTALVLGYIKVLAWPLVIVGLVIWLRDIIKAKIMGTTEFSAGPIKATFSVEDRLAASAIITNKVNTDLEEGPSALVVEPEGIPSAQAGGEQAVTQHQVIVNDSAVATDHATVAIEPDEEAERRAAIDQETQRRAAIEKAMRASAEWGWNMAHIGFTRPPIPVIEWTSQGHPAIQYGTTDPGAVRSGLVQASRMGGAPTSPMQYDPSTHASNIEAELRRLMAQRDSKFGDIGQTMQIVSLAEKIRRLRDRLRQVDPNSALLDD